MVSPAMKPGNVGLDSSLASLWLSMFWLDLLKHVLFLSSILQVNTYLYRSVCNIIGEIIAKDNLNIENLMQTFENLLLQNYSSKFFDITYK